jgi:membrane fusion protein, type I secretion system
MSNGESTAQRTLRRALERVDALEAALAGRLAALPANLSALQASLPRLWARLSALRASLVRSWRRSAFRVGAAGAQGSIRKHVTAIAATAGLLVGSVGLMGATTDLSGAVIALGSLVVESNVKKVQHPTGGVVGELLVRDGSRVGAGDLLIRLDPTEAQANLTAVTKALWELTARRARLETERDGSETIAFPSDLTEAAADAEIDRIVAGERRLFELRREALRGQKAQLRERVAQFREEINGLAEQIDAKNQEIDFIQKELNGVRELFEKNLIPITRLTALERDGARLKGERGHLVAANAQTKGKISEIELQIIQLDQNLRSEVAKELADIRAKMSDLTEKKVTATEQLQRIDIRAPQSGFVHQLAVHTKRGVISAGEQILLIVPEADALIVEAKVAPNDIDQVQLDQPAVLRFPTFNQRTTPELAGTVSRIAADTTRDDRTGTSYYLVRIGINSGEIARLNGLKLVPGMPVEAFLRTEDRTMLSYLLKPLTDQARRAFREK